MFSKKHAEHLGMSSSLNVVKIEGMRPRRAIRIMGRKFMWPSRLCHFRRYRYASVKLSVFPIITTRRSEERRDDDAHHYD